MADVESTDADGDTVIYRYQWVLNGTLWPGQEGGSFLPLKLKRGDLLMVIVTPSDGKVDGVPAKSHAVSVGNTAPEIARITLEPESIRIGDRVKATVESFDPDQDLVEFTYRWLKNDRIIQEGESPFLETAGFVRGDTLGLVITPSDSSAKGRPVSIEPLILPNSPPRITSVPPHAIVGGRYQYTVTATDTDNDSLAFSLEAAPAGMSIDSTTGQIEWRITSKTRGLHRVRVAVGDGHGGRAFQEFDLVPTPPS